MFGDYRDSETGIEYIMLEDGTYVGEQTSLIICSQCESRYTTDLERDLFGYYMPHPKDFLGIEDREPLCSHCIEQGLTEALDNQTLDLLERKLGLNEGNYKALNAVIELVDNPDRMYQVVNVHERVNELERRLEDRTDSIEREVSSKLHSSSLWLNGAIAVGGFLAGVVVTLLSILLVAG